MKVKKIMLFAGAALVASSALVFTSCSDSDDPEMQPSDEFLNMTKEDWQHLDIEKYRRLFKGSAVKRAKYEGLMRNIHAASEEEE